MLSCLSPFWALLFRLMHFLLSHKGGGPGWSALLRGVAAARHSSGAMSQVWDPFTTGCDKAPVPFFFILSDKGVIQLVRGCSAMGWGDAGFSGCRCFSPVAEGITGWSSSKLCIKSQWYLLQSLRKEFRSNSAVVGNRH